MTEKTTDKLCDLLWVLFGATILSGMIMGFTSDFILLLVGLTFAISGGLTAAVAVSIKSMGEAYEKDIIEAEKIRKELKRKKSIGEYVDEDQKNIKPSNSVLHEKLWTSILEKLPG